MKKAITFILFIFSLSAALGQSVTQRSTPTITAADARWMANRNMFIPRYTDSVAANLDLGVDTCGAMFYAYSTQSIWYRQCSPKKWVQISGGGGSGVTAANNILTLSGSTVQFGGTATQNNTAALGTTSLEWTTGGAMATNITPFKITATPTSFTGTAYSAASIDLSGVLTGLAKNPAAFRVTNTQTHTGGQNLGLYITVNRAATNTAIYVDSGYISMGDPAPAGKLHIVSNDLQATSTEASGIILGNNTPSTVGTQRQVSPMIENYANAWKTNATAGRQTAYFRQFLYVNPGTDSITSLYKFMASIESTTNYFDVFAIGNKGQLYLRDLNPGTANQVLVSGGATAPATWINQSSIVGAVPTFQSVLAAGSTGITTRTISGTGSSTLQLNNFDEINFTAGGNSHFDGGTWAFDTYLNVADSAFFTALNNNTSQDKLIGWKSSDFHVGYINIGTGLSLSAGTLSAAAGGLTVGTSPIASGSTTNILRNNAGVLAEYTITGTGTVVAMQTSPSFTTSLLTGSSTFGLLTANATTVNAFSAATTLNIQTSASAGAFNVGGGATPVSFGLLEGSAGGTNKVGFKAPATLAGDNIYTMPSAFPAGNGYLLTSSTTGVLTLTDPASLTGGPYWNNSGTTTLGSNNTINLGGNSVSFKQSGTDILFVDPTGLVGINTSTPTVALDVVGSSNISGVLQVAQDFNAATNGTYTIHLLRTDVGNGAVDVGAANGEGNSTRYRVDDVNQQIRFYNSSASIIIDALSAGGAVTAGAGTGTLSVVSDGRLKHDISPYQFGLKEILQTNPITFRYNEDQKMGNSLYAGFDARDIYKIYGSLGAGTDSKGYHSLFDKALIAANINATKELYQIVVDLKVEFENYKRTHP